jgi:hypothetical protein
MQTALDRFSTSIGAARTSDEVWSLLQDLTRELPGHKLFTVMTVDMEAGLARRAFTSHPREYPASGTKPIERNSWFDIVHGQRRSFVANSIEDIAAVFPDHALIASLGCGSVFNLPVVLQDDLVATINMLAEPGHYTPERVREAEAFLKLPASLCCALAARPGASHA